MSRHHHRRGRLVEAEELDGVIAVKTGAAPQERVTERETHPGSSARGEIREAGIGDETTEAFARASWICVRPNRRAREALATGDEIPSAEAAGKVIRRPSGRTGVATDALTGRSEPTPSKEEAERELETAVSTVVNGLRFAENLDEVRAPASRDALAASAELHGNGRFFFAEPSFTEHAPARFGPTGARHPRQRQGRNAGTTGGTSEAGVHIQSAWDRTFGTGIRVAVIDNGFDTEPPDLAAGMDRLSGFFTDRAGGTGAASEYNLMPPACLPDQVGTQTTPARAMACATGPSTEVPGAGPGSGADILVSSLGPDGAHWDLTGVSGLALEFAAAKGRQGKGTPICWAASNGRNVGIARDEVVSRPDVIAVVRSTHQDWEDNAARGPKVELIAPGADVLSTASGGGYGTSTGTGFAGSLRGRVRGTCAGGERPPHARPTARGDARVGRQDRRAGSPVRRSRSQRRLRLRQGERLPGRHARPRDEAMSEEPRSSAATEVFGCTIECGDTCRPVSAARER
ncbi:hypothetical protein ABZ892_24405 [Streptomyces sp. NPDC046924]|uniref:hypothetical protein n=1 Tax=Streptomyces sp. NPDC046924 TaxID=3155136 RepID=UPI0033F6F1BC